MMRLLFACLLVILACGSSVAKDPPRYPVALIPETLRENAYAVVRDDHMHFTVLSTSSATLRIHYAVTIFHDKGRHFARQVVWYNKLRKVGSLKGYVYDAEGNLLKKLKNNEIRDQSAYDGLFGDDRVKIADLAQPRFPYTVEFEYEIKYNYLYHIDGSAFNQYENVAVENASYTLTFPQALTPRYKVYNIDVAPEEKREGTTVSLTWNIKHVPAPRFEKYSDRQEVIMAVRAAPRSFDFDGYAGTMETWDDYGRWIASLSKGRDALPESTKQHVQQLTASLTSREEKVRTLYKFLQSKTRYVSIQLGIGGYQPFEAMVVDKNGYGDCKALSNYMLALLETVGIKGHYALIRAGEGAADLEPDFPSSQFNHALVAVPNGRDTLWLECTSQQNPFGYQGSFTGNRKALLITDDGAEIVNTTRYPAELNTQNTIARVTLREDGSALGSVVQVLSGLQYENGSLHAVINGQPDDQKRWVERTFDIPAFSVAQLAMENDPGRIPSARVTADVKMPRLATASGKRLFLTPNLMNRLGVVPPRLDHRETDIIRKFAYTDTDTIRFSLPEGIYPEFVPDDVAISTAFGEYEATFQVQPGELVYIRKLIMYDGTFPASTYNDFVDFFRDVNRADNTKLVFMTKT